LFCKKIMEACEAKEHGHDSKQRHKVEGPIMQAKEWIGMAIRVRVPGTRRVPNPTVTGMGTIFHPWVAPIPNPA
jgi:hypothetical protein